MDAMKIHEQHGYAIVPDRLFRLTGNLETEVLGLDRLGPSLLDQASGGKR